MGLSNTVTPGPACPKCQGALEWQSKALYIREFPIENQCALVELAPDISGEAHTACCSCNWWYEARIDCGEMTIVWDDSIYYDGTKSPRFRQTGFTYLDCKGEKRVREGAQE